MLVGLSIMEHLYHAVIEVISRAQVTELATVMASAATQCTSRSGIPEKRDWPWFSRPAHASVTLLRTAQSERAGPGRNARGSP